jgi:SPP1 gp7 family putative phage head morphogenesis protein
VPQAPAVIRTVHDELLDRTIRHAVFLERYKKSLFLRLLDGLEDEGFDKVIAETTRHIARLNRMSRSRLTGELGRMTIANMVKDQREILKAAYTAARQKASAELIQFSITEAEWIRAAIRSTVPVTLDFSTPSKRVLRALVTQHPAHGKLVREWFDDLSDASHKRISQATRIGIARGESTDRIVRSLVGTKAEKFKDGVVQASRHQLDAAVRTIAADVSASAREETYKESGVVEAVQWVATLETSTCPICGGLDGRVFKVDEGPRPTIHPRCRCGTAPVLKSWKALGIDLAEAPEGTRAQMPGSRGVATEGTKFPDWLGRQSKEWQDENLGPTRARLFRSGRVQIKEFVDYSRTPPRLFTLDELRRREGLD